MRELERMKSETIHKDDINASMREEIRDKERMLKVVRDDSRVQEGALRDNEEEGRSKEKQIDQ